MRCWVVILVSSTVLDVGQSWIGPLAITGERSETSRIRARRRRTVVPPSSLLRSSPSPSPSPSQEDSSKSVKSTPPFPSSRPVVTVPRRRLQVAGVSVAPAGFHVILQVNASHFLPLRVTDDAMDASSASSPQALTILQLLARVDMAGAILPPDALAKIVVLTLEGETGDELAEGVGRRAPPASSTPVGAKFLEHVQERIRKLEYTNATTYTELHEYPWLQSRVALPTVTLDELILSPRRSSSAAASAAATTAMSYTLVCSVKIVKAGSALSVELAESVCEGVSYEYRPNGVSMAFLAAALALRYRAPIELSLGDECDDDGAFSSSFAFMNLDEIREAFPLYRTAAQLQQTTERVTSNIEKGLKVNQLQAALRMALQKEDFAAAAKIRGALDEMDSLNDLPTQPESDTDSMQ